MWSKSRWSQTVADDLNICTHHRSEIFPVWTCFALNITETEILVSKNYMSSQQPLFQLFSTNFLTNCLISFQNDATTYSFVTRERCAIKKLYQQNFRFFILFQNFETLKKGALALRIAFFESAFFQNSTCISKPLKYISNLENEIDAQK
jgi:hypothetical protein